MSFKAVTIINGEVHDGLITSVEPERIEISDGMVQTPYKGEITMLNGKYQIKQNGMKEVNMSDLRMTDGIMSTAVNSGMPVRHESAVRDSTLVTVNGVQMTAKMAAEAGILCRDSNGSYFEIGKKSDPLQGDDDFARASNGNDDTDANEPIEAGMSEDLFDGEVESCLESLAQGLGGYASLDRHAISAMGALAEGDITGCAKRLASESGAEPAQAAAFITGVAERFIDRSAKYMSRMHGVDGYEVIAWAEQNIPSHERASLAHQVYLGKTSALDGMVKKYKSANR